MKKFIYLSLIALLGSATLSTLVAEKDKDKTEKKEENEKKNQK